MIKAEINNQTDFRIPRKQIDSLLKLVQKKIKTKKQQIVSLGFVSPSVIKKLNKIYRKKDQATDVLSFAGEGETMGDIIICAAIAEKQARQFKHSFSKEIIRLVLHGYLHLLGYNHEKKGEARKMEALEKSLLAS